VRRAAATPPDSLGCRATGRLCRHRQEQTSGRESPSFCTEQQLSTVRYPSFNKATMTIKMSDFDEEEAIRLPRFHTSAWRRKKKQKKKRCFAYDDSTREEKSIQIFPTMALPLVADVPVPESTVVKEDSEKCGKKKKKKKLKTQLKSVVNFASATLGRSLGVHDNLAARARIRALAWSAEAYRRRTSELPPRKDISGTAMIYLRETFKIQCTQGALKRPVNHVEFDYPRSISACCACSSSDFLYVFVGLFNIFVVQLALVVIMFFAEKEIDLNSLDTYYKPPATLFQ
jgi:hypothetical protein